VGDGSADQFGLNWAIVPFHGWVPWLWSCRRHLRL